MFKESCLNTSNLWKKGTNNFLDVNSKCGLFEFILELKLREEEQLCKDELNCKVRGLTRVASEGSQSEKNKAYSSLWLPY